jgi:hypothetical protein
MSSTPTTLDDNGTVFIDIMIGVVVILIGAIIYVGRLLYKRRKRKREEDHESVLDSVIEMEEMDIEPSPKKTAADHLGELKEATQKALQPLRKSSSFSSPKENLSLNLTNLSSGSSSSSIKTRHDNKIFKDPFIIRPFKVPPPPPPSPLRKDNIRVEPIRMSLLNLLLTNNSKITSSIPETNYLSRTLPQSDLTPPPETNLKKDLTRETLSQSDLRHPPEINSKRDSLRKSLSYSDLKYPTEKNSKKDLLRTKLSQPDLKHPPLSQLDLTSPSKTRSKSVVTISPRTVPSETHLKTRTKSRLDQKIRSKRSNIYTYSHNKETNDYTNFQPIQNIKPLQNARTVQLEKRTMAVKFAETEKAGELTLSPMYSIVKPVLKESQDDEIILDASLE